MIKLAEYINALRVFPRLALVFFGYLLLEGVRWYFGLAEPTTNQTAGFTALLGSSAAWFTFYVNSGPKK